MDKFLNLCQIFFSEHSGAITLCSKLLPLLHNGNDKSGQDSYLFVSAVTTDENSDGHLGRHVCSTVLSLIPTIILSEIVSHCGSTSVSYCLMDIKLHSLCESSHATTMIKLVCIFHMWPIVCGESIFSNDPRCRRCR